MDTSETEWKKGNVNGGMVSSKGDVDGGTEVNGILVIIRIFEVKTGVRNKEVCGRILFLHKRLVVFTKPFQSTTTPYSTTGVTKETQPGSCVFFPFNTCYRLYFTL